MRVFEVSSPKPDCLLGGTVTKWTNWGTWVEFEWLSNLIILLIIITKEELDNFWYSLLSRTLHTMYEQEIPGKYIIPALECHYHKKQRIVAYNCFRRRFLYLVSYQHHCKVE